ncbi:protease modulator HflC [Limisphaera sp. VF-2]|uniref:protease modulator HflC n=1 Tax=Limisphaera sp. VF-2 TaxID=3400418 RepID=UPI00177037E9|nr:protease modulator HflC [Limisphaera sp.]
MKRPVVTLIVGALLVAIFALLLFTFQVRQSEVAVVTTFGQPTRNISEPGAYLKWPWPIQRVYKFDRRVQVFEDKFTEGLTADNNNLLTAVYVGWRIEDAQAFFPKFGGGSIQAAERMLEGVLGNAKGAVVGRYQLSDFINADPTKLKFDQIERDILALVDAQLRTNNTGIRIEFLGIKKIGLPESVTQTVFDRMTSERKVLVSRLENEGEAEAQKIRAQANRQAAEILAAAEAEATRIRGEGEAAAAQILPVFERNPALANFELRLRALEQALKERTTLIFDERTPPFDVFQGFLTNRAAR